MANQINLEWVQKGVEQVKSDIKEVSSMVEKTNREKVEIKFEDGSLNQYKKDLQSLISLNKDIREAMGALPKNSDAWKTLNSESNKLYKSISALKKELINTGDVGAKAVVDMINAQQKLDKQMAQSARTQKMNNEAIIASQKAYQESIKQSEKDTKRLNEILLKMQSLSRMMSDQNFAGKTGKKGKTPLDMSWAIDQYKELRLEAEGLIKVLGEDSQAVQHFRNGMAWTEANNPLRALRDEATKLIPKIASAEAELKKLSIDPSKNASQIKALQGQLNTWKESYGQAITEFQNQINRIKQDKSGIFTENDIKILESSKQVLIDQLQTLTEIKVAKQESRNEDILTEQNYKTIKAELQERFALEEKLAKLQQNPSKHQAEISALKQILAAKRDQKELEEEINKLPQKYRDELNKIIAEQKEQHQLNQTHNSDLQKNNKTLGESLKNFMKFTAYYFVLQKMKQLVNEMLETMKELDKAFTDIQMVTGGTDEETAQLADSYNQLAKEVGSTTTEVAEGASEWLRQRKNY